jgi:hypothetical protein
MPTEILERIINFAVQDPPFLAVGYWGRPQKQSSPFRWDPDWLPSLLCVSKSIRQVARSIFSRHIELRFDGLYWYGSHHGALPADVKRKYLEHFGELLGADEQGA